MRAREHLRRIKTEHELLILYLKQLRRDQLRQRLLQRGSPVKIVLFEAPHSPPPEGEQPQCTEYSLSTVYEVDDFVDEFFDREEVLVWIDSAAQTLVRKVLRSG